MKKTRLMYLILIALGSFLATSVWARGGGGGGHGEGAVENTSVEDKGVESASEGALVADTEVAGMLGTPVESILEVANISVEALVTIVAAVSVIIAAVAWGASGDQT